jgi:CMP-N,N'-diacetyllegionaminic acid synthase
MTRSLLGVVTARGGSKSIPGKNLKLLRGKPLLAYPIEAARESGVFDRVILSTDDPEIAVTARRLGCEVPFLRPSDLARDDTPHLPVMQHAVAWLDQQEQYRPDFVMILQPTAPLLRASHIRAALALLESSGADSVVGVTSVSSHNHPMRMIRIDATGAATLFVTGEPVRRRIGRRQDLPAAWAINGVVYLFRRPVLFAPEPSLYGDRSVAYVMAPDVSISIDEPRDWAEAERALDQLSIAGPG